jgi:hypothetical protein
MPITTLLHPYPARYPSPAVHYLCQSWWTCSSTSSHTWRNRCDSLLATGQMLSVIPATIRDTMEVVVEPVRGWKGRVPSWYGIACRIGRVTLWLPIEEEPGRYRELSLLGLLPKEDLEDAPPFILLGTQFLLEYQAQVVLDCSGATNPGRLLLPE